MLDKRQIESILKINGLATSAPDEEIRSVLVSARFNDDEVQTAMMVLRENTTTNETHVDGLHKVFRTDQALKPSEIFNLLGIEVNIESTIEKQEKQKRYTLFQVFLLWGTSMIIAITVLMFYMYSQDIGFFHPSSTTVFKI